MGWGTTGQDNSNSNDAGGGNEQNDSWGSNTNENQAVTDWDNGDNGGTQETAQNDPWAPVQPNGWSTGSNKSNETVRKGDHWGNDTYPGASGDWDHPKDGVSSVGQGADNNVGVCGANDGNANGNGNRNGNENGQPVSSAGDNSDNVMPGTWVETPGVPSWGDATAAQETNGAADVW